MQRGVRGDGVRSNLQEPVFFFFLKDAKDDASAVGGPSSQLPFFVVGLDVMKASSEISSFLEILPTKVEGFPPPP